MQGAETGQTDSVAILDMAGCERHQVVQRGFGLLSREIVPDRLFGGHLLERDGGLRGIFLRRPALF